MAYSTPPQGTNLELIGPADWNVLVDDITDLDRRATAESATVATAETRSSTAYGNLATGGPVTLAQIGAQGLALVILTADISNNTGGAAGAMGFAISGPTTVAASDAQSYGVTSASPGYGVRGSAMFVVTGLNSGIHTFSSQYRVTGGTGTFAYRTITVLPLSA